MSSSYTGNPAQPVIDINAADIDPSSAAVRLMERKTQVDSFSAFSSITGITFPQGLGDDPAQPFFMTFIPKKITSAVGGTMGDMSFQSVAVTKNNIAQVALPIPTGINVAYAQSWDMTDVNAVQGGVMRTGGFQSAAGQLRKTAEGNADTTIKGGLEGIADLGLSAIDMAGAAGQNALDSLGASMAAGGVSGTISDIMSKIGQIGVSGNAIAGVTLGVAGKLLGPAMSTAAGFSSFNQVMAHYQGPAFRNFSFGFTLRPLEVKDQQNIVKIVDFFKIASAPAQISNGLYRVYETPYVFKIGFFSKKGELADVNKIAHCACTNVAVSYGGDRFQTFSGTDSPVETNIALTFKEIELITRTEMEDGY